MSKPPAWTIKSLKTEAARRAVFLVDLRSRIKNQALCLKEDRALAALTEQELREAAKYLNDNTPNEPTDYFKEYRVKR